MLIAQVTMNQIVAAEIKFGSLMPMPRKMRNAMMKPKNRKEQPKRIQKTVQLKGGSFIVRFGKVLRY